jgi:hypothetical protein
VGIELSTGIVRKSTLWNTTAGLDRHNAAECTASGERKLMVSAWLRPDDWLRVEIRTVYRLGPSPLTRMSMVAATVLRIEREAL